MKPRFWPAPTSLVRMILLFHHCAGAPPGVSRYGRSPAAGRCSDATDTCPLVRSRRKTVRPAGLHPPTADGVIRRLGKLSSRYPHALCSCFVPYSENGRCTRVSTPLSVDALRVGLFDQTFLLTFEPIEFGLEFIEALLALVLAQCVATVRGERVDFLVKRGDHFVTMQPCLHCGDVLDLHPAVTARITEHDAELRLIATQMRFTFGSEFCGQTRWPLLSARTSAGVRPQPRGTLA